LVDGDIETARERAAAIARCDGIRLVEDSLDIETCEGAATIGPELAEAAGSFDAVLVSEASIIAGAGRPQWRCAGESAMRARHRERERPPDAAKSPAS
jgi:hypothetical protein